MLGYVIVGFVALLLLLIFLGLGGIAFDFFVVVAFLGIVLAGAYDVIHGNHHNA